MTARWRRRAIRPHDCGAFTLVETLVSSGLIGVLLIGMGSAIALSTRAIPSADQAGQGRIAAANALEQLSADLKHARFVLDREPDSVTLIVQDRTGNHAAERIRYAWDGDEGGVLTRQLNHGEPRVLLRVSDFELGYELSERTWVYPGPLSESGEQQLAAYMPLGVDEGYAVTQTNWAGQYIVPSLPADAVSWRPTGASFKARRREGGPLWVQLVRASEAKEATYTVLAHASIDASSLPTLLYESVDVTFENAEPVGAGDPVALIFRNDGTDIQPAYVGYQLLGSDRLSTTDGGASWTHRSLQSTLFSLEGVVTRQGPEQTTRLETVEAVSARLASAEEPDDALYARVHLRNEPTVAAAAWKLAFERDPTAVDLMGTGSADWAGESVEEPGGTWSSQMPLQTEPPNDFDRVTEVELRMRHGGMGSDGAVFRIFADRVENEAAELRAELHRQTDGSQTLLLLNPGNTDEVLTEVPNLPPGFVNVGLVIDPSYGTVLLLVEGREHGTFAYERRGVNTSGRHAALLGDAEAEFDLVRIHVGR